MNRISVGVAVKGSDWSEPLAPQTGTTWNIVPLAMYQYVMC